MAQRHWERLGIQSALSNPNLGNIYCKNGVPGDKPSIWCDASMLKQHMVPLEAWGLCYVHIANFPKY